MYSKRYIDENTYQIIEYFAGGERVIPADQHDYVTWLAEGNTPTIEAEGRFLSVVDGVLVVDPNKDTILFTEAKEAKINAISNLRDSKIATGIPYTFPDGAGTIQTRDEKDFRNITGLSTSGIVMAGQAVNMPFRDQENIVHSMTPEQVVAMGMFIAAAIQSVYTASWVHADAIKQLTTLAEIEAYDISVGW